MPCGVAARATGFPVPARHAIDAAATSEAPAMTMDKTFDAATAEARISRMWLDA